MKATTKRFSMKRKMRPPSFMVLHKLKIDYSRSIDMETMKDKAPIDKREKIEGWTFINEEEF